MNVLAQTALSVDVVWAIVMASSDAQPAEDQLERIHFVLDPALPGLELVSAENSMREWKVFNTVHSISLSESWLGQVHYRGRKREVVPGNVFCTEPGEAHTTSRPATPGALKVLMIDEQPLREQLAELDFYARDICFAESVTSKAAPQLRRLVSLLTAPGRTPLELQSAFVELAEVVSRELLSDGHADAVPKGDAIELADTMRDLLHASVEQGTSLSLDELAAAANIGKFRALRAFKRRHGIPPHTYELCLRLSRARELLKTGMSAAASAMECGFADQSHMTRHFRAFYGYTPGMQRRAATRPGRR